MEAKREADWRIRGGAVMTVGDVLLALLRRWPITLIGLVATSALVFVAVQDRAVYWNRAEVVFLAPSSRLYPNSLSTTSADLISTAGVVSKRITGAGKVTKYASPEVSLVGLGVRDGWSIRLPDTGGQWASNFASQTLVVEVVGPDPDVVRERSTELVDRIAAELDTLQRDAGVDPVNDITTTLAPESTVIHRMAGSRTRAAAMTALLGAATTIAVAVLVELRGRRRTRAGDRPDRL